MHHSHDQYSNLGGERYAEDLANQIKSPEIKSSERLESLCSVKFHNCTPYNVTLYWLNTRGEPVQYPSLNRGDSIEMDTFIGHRWYFKSQNADQANDNRQIRLIAVPEDELMVEKVLSSDLESGVQSGKQTTNVEISQHGENQVLICSLCKLMLQKYDKAPRKVPCPHFTGEAKVSGSDLGYSWQEADDKYIYSCDQRRHCRDHATNRRNIFLLESFFDLRERCYMALIDKLKHGAILGTTLPRWLQQDYVKFLAISKKIGLINSKI